jgi:2-(1,2-epoxy-1,2-dihydrophenyl)acetyl-CoA isomerase
VGGGLDLALACDFRFAASAAKFLPGYTAMAYSPDGGSSYFLPRLIGEARAKAFLLQDEAWSTEQAFAAGLITAHCAPEQLQNEVMSLASKLASGPTFAYGRINALLASSLNNDLPTQLRAEKTAALACGHSIDAQEILCALAEKRAANLIGR